MSFEEHPINTLHRAGPPKFVETSPEVLIDRAIGKIEAETGRKISRSQVEYYMIMGLAYMMSVRGEEEQLAIARQYLAYLDGTYLDAFGVARTMPRIAAKAAVATVKFIAAQGHARIAIPSGTRVGDASGQVQFAVQNDGWIEVGEAHIALECAALGVGVGANGYGVGQLDQLIDPIVGVASVVSISESAGGAPAETDDHYRGRLAMRYEKLGDGITRERYQLDVFNWSARTVDVSVTRPQAGHVDVRPLMDNGAPTPAEIANLQAFFDASEPHQGDDITVMAPTPHDFTFTLNLRVTSGAAVAPAQQAVQGVLDLWSRALGGYVAPSDLSTSARKITGVVDADIPDLVFATVPETAWRRCTGFATNVTVI